MDQTLTDGRRATPSTKRIQSIEVVGILSNEKEVEKLSREDVTFLSGSGPASSSTAAVSCRADEARTSYLRPGRPPGRVFGGVGVLGVWRGVRGRLHRGRSFVKLDWNL